MHNRLAPYLLTIFSLVGLTIIQFQPQRLFVVGGILLFLVIGFFYLGSGQKIIQQYFWVMLVPPLWLILSSISLIIIAESEIFRWMLAVFTPFVLGFYLKQIYIYNYNPEQYQPYALENLSVSINIFVVFLAASSLFGLKLFLGLNLSVIWVIFFVVSLTLAYQTFWVHKLKLQQMIWWLIAVVALLMQLFVSMGFLPVQYIVSGLMVAIAFYLLIGLSRLVIRQAFRRRLVAQQIILSSVLTLIILITARWI
ncbi:MAG: hypothetical protein V1853_02545 [bacterium]